MCATRMLQNNGLSGRNLLWPAAVHGCLLSFSMSLCSKLESDSKGSFLPVGSVLIVLFGYVTLILFGLKL